MKVRNLIISILAVLILSGCAAEVKLAKQFANPAQPYRAAVYFPETAQVTLIQSEDGTYTKVLDSLDQNAFLDILYGAYADELRRYGVDVYIPESQDDVPTDSIHWLVILSKMEIQGLFTPYVDYLFDLEDEYEYTFPLNTVNVAAWFDINNGSWRPTVFYEHNLTDDFNSHVSVSWKDGTQYHYDIKPLCTDDLYHYSVFLGKLYASYTFDYMMNCYIEEEMGKKNVVPRFRLGWDPYEKTLVIQEEEEFIELKDEN